jgi:hypothetical protein
MGGWFWAIFFAIAIFFGAVYTDTQHQLGADNVAGEASAISGNMMVYRNAVSQYARANPSATGTVSDASLSLPPWYARISGISNYVAGGKGYVYYSNQRGELAYQLLKNTNNTMLSGIKRSGVLYNPVSGTSTITIPSAIPDESVVYGDG